MENSSLSGLRRWGPWPDPGPPYRRAPWWQRSEVFPPSGRIAALRRGRLERGEAVDLDHAVAARIPDRFPRELLHDVLVASLGRQRVLRDLQRRDQETVRVLIRVGQRPAQIGGLVLDELVVELTVGEV